MASRDSNIGTYSIDGQGPSDQSQGSPIQSGAVQVLSEAQAGAVQVPFSDSLGAVQVLHKNDAGVVVYDPRKGADFVPVAKQPDPFDWNKALPLLLEYMFKFLLVIIFAVVVILIAYFLYSLGHMDRQIKQDAQNNKFDELREKKGSLPTMAEFIMENCKDAWFFDYWCSDRYEQLYKKAVKNDPKITEKPEENGTPEQSEDEEQEKDEL